MAQADYVISPNPTGLAMRTEVNQIFQAILTNNSGSVAPTTTQAGMFWGDISNALTYYLKIRNHTNDGWVSLYAYDVATKTISPVNTPAGNISSTTTQGAINELDTEKQATLVSGTNIKTVNSTSLLGSGNVAVQPTLVSGTNIKTVNGTSLLGSGDISITETAWESNDSRAKTALNATGSAPIYACRAWVNFNGTGTVAIRASGNVSSITDNGVGDYTVNFTTALPDANYGISSIGALATNYLFIVPTGTPSTTQYQLLTSNVNGTAQDPTAVSIAIHR